MPKVKLTEKRVARLVDTRATKKHEIYWDRLLPSFGLRRRREGARTYVVGGRFGGEHYKPLELGDAREIDLKAAKAKAREWLVADSEGRDPRQLEAAKAAAEAAKKLEEGRRNGTPSLPLPPTFSTIP